MPDLAAPAVDVIVPTYGDPRYLRACLRALRQSIYTNYQLIVVDDAAPSPALPTVAEEHPGALVLRGGRNGGLVRALNRGIDRGVAPLIALLNDDAEVTPGWLGALVECAGRNPRAGSIASKLMLQSDRGKFHSAGDGFGAWGMPFNRGVWLDDLGQYEREEQVFGACAGAALYRRSALESVRLPSGDIFDSRLWMYLEDVDLAWRLQLGGYSCVYTPAARVFHHLSATGGGKLASFQVSRNIWHILFRSMPRDVLIANARRIAAHHIGRNIRHARYMRAAEARASLAGSLAGIGLAARALVEGDERATSRDRAWTAQRTCIERSISHC